MQTQLAKLKSTYAEYPKTFWTLATVIFIDKIGSFLLFPFFALYITKKFDVGMTQVGILFALFSISSFFGSFIGGALTDRIGRRSMIIFSLLTSAFSTLAMGFVNTLEAFYVEGRSLQEMSGDFQAPLGTIKRRLHVARKRLAKQVDPLTAGITAPVPSGCTIPITRSCAPSAGL